MNVGYRHDKLPDIRVAVVSVDIMVPDIAGVDHGGLGPVLIPMNSVEPGICVTIIPTIIEVDLGARYIKQGTVFKSPVI